MSQGKTVQSAPEQRRRTDSEPPPVPVREQAYSYYESHPEHRQRHLTARQVRRRRIREG
jgi:hypothetical protein